MYGTDLYATLRATTLAASEEGQVSAQQRRVIGDTPQSRTDADLTRRVFFDEIRVQVRDLEVRTVGVTWKRSRRLGSIVGASAGVTDQKQLSMGAKLRAGLLSTTPRIGTIFVAFADGTRYETPLRLGSDEQTAAIEAEVARFNAMAAAAAE
jgi:hypothetical protein